MPFEKVKSVASCKSDATEYPTKNSPADYALASITLRVPRSVLLKLPNKTLVTLLKYARE